MSGELGEPGGMPPDQQEALSIRHSSLVAIALLASGRWAVYTTVPLARDSFRNEVIYFDAFPTSELQAIADQERARRAQYDIEYEERHAELAGGPAINIESTANLEDMGL